MGLCIAKSNAETPALTSLFAASLCKVKSGTVGFTFLMAGLGPPINAARLFLKSLSFLGGSGFFYSSTFCNSILGSSFFGVSKGLEILLG